MSNSSLYTKQNILRNIVYKNIDKSISAMYAPAQSSFDLIFSELPKVLLTNIDNNYYHYYDMLIANSPIDHAQRFQALAHHLQIQDIVWFHGAPAYELKKEDLVLIKNQLSRLTVSVFPSEKIASSWGYSRNVNLISYGIPNNDYLVNQKTKKVILLNLSNNSSINNLYNYIKQSIPDIDIINTLDGLVSINDLYKILNQYSLCIDIYDSINSLVALNCGCRCITATEQDKELIGVTRLLDYKNIIEVINDLLKDNLQESDISNNIQYIKQRYSMENFETKTLELFNNIKYKEFFKL